MNTPPLFSHPDLWIVPDRGRYTAAEALDEWLDFLPALMERWDGWKGTPEAEQIDRCARHAFEQSEIDAAKLLPHLDDAEDGARLQRLQELRDSVREYVASPASFVPSVETSEAEQIEFYAADLRASMREQIRIAADLIRQAGPPPVAPEKKQFILDGWKCMARTIISTADLPGLDPATVDVLEELIHASDRVLALWDAGQPQEGVG